MVNMELQKITYLSESVKINNIFDTLAPLSENYPDRKVLSFINNTKFLDVFYSNKDVSCLICTEEIYEILEKEYLKNNKIGIIVSENPKDIFFKIQNYLVKETEFYFKNFSNIISDKSKIHPTAVIEDKNIIIEDGVEIGANTIIYSNTVIKKNCKIGANCIIGGESFSFNNFNKIYAGGRVILEENVELLGNNSIERGIYRDTVIKENTKISYGSVIEHDVEIGKNSLICANVTITGRVKAGDNCYFGPGSVIRNGLEIENNGRANMGAVVTKNIKENEHVSGNFAVEHKKYLEFIKKIGD
ncbi:DapH/DapD/GlmU-related protein [Fusobacterium sp.]|uniref:DapH/DapD/GlmU-related protein n=1 Tax=Fusobacterium sp. TaxID=68766 RepID=UPI001D579468|nr:DapH/DapD/GlmU-related protein [Fusobacterium sp.]MBS5790293.1 UDP-3-O-(3-hydroxymyristoyl)glucosamine N-acyltransferase [Fusobacterium sp.]